MAVDVRYVSTRLARAIAIGCAVVPLCGAKPPEDVLIRVYYDLEVAAYCGLVSTQVQQGFRAEADQIEREAGATRQDVEQARMQAWKLANLEWQNRGLGGFKRWCREDGTEAADRFLNEGTD